MTKTIVGLTGSPGCGKSEIGKIFSTFSDWDYLNADKICSEIYSEQNSIFLQKLESHWSKSIYLENGSINKKFIAEKIFNNKQEKLWLESILHPLIFSRLQLQISQLQNPFILVELPLLFESVNLLKLDYIIVVWSSPQIQLKRLLARGWTKEHAQKRIDNQLSGLKKLKLADYTIINDSTLEELQEQCRLIESKIRQSIK